MEEMQETSDLSWIEVQFLKKAVDVTVESRMTLKWTYAFAFYLEKSHQTEIFEVNNKTFFYLLSVYHTQLYL